jgi:hypothetical protein
MRVISGPPIGRLTRFPHRLHCQHKGCDTLFEIQSPADLLVDEADPEQGGRIVQRPPRFDEVLTVRCPTCRLIAVFTKYQIPDGGLRLVK